MRIVRLVYRFYQEIYLKPRTRLLLLIYKNRLKKDYPDEIKYLREKIEVIPYSCDDVEDVSIEKDYDGFFYGNVGGNKLFFPKGMTRNECASYFSDLNREQSKYSPHKYIDEEFDIDGNCILIDCGAAEGNFSLAVIDRVKKVMMFEGDNTYIECLRKTFAPWKEKVKIVPQYIGWGGKKSEDGAVCLDEYFDQTQGESIFLKMDLEGQALKILDGCKQLLRNNNCKVACACYHYPTEADELYDFFKTNLPEYRLTFRPGYMFMWFAHDLKYPFFRKGMLRACKTN